MKLQVPFVQLPISFDARALAAEIAAVEESDWRPHPNGYPGNSALTLISRDGDPDNDDLAGPMRPTPALARLPMVREVLAVLGGTWGRSRLMRLSGQAEVTEHVDTNYYWRERMRVHVPIATTPDVRFLAGAAETHMRAGECWIFDTWSRHRVINSNDSTRIHLVADTVGGAALWDLIAGGRPSDRQLPGWQARPCRLPGTGDVHLDFESVNLQPVMTPWEIREHCVFLLGETIPHPRLPMVQQGLLDFARRWHALWSAFGEHRDGWPRYRRLLDDARADAIARGAGEIGLRNEVGLMHVLDMYIFGVALSDDGLPAAVAQKDAHGGETKPPRPAASAGRRRIVSPVFIISPPRSGSTLLFETLSKAAGVSTIGDESHALIEGIHGLAPATRGYHSNRLDASDAGAETIARLQERFTAALRDREGKAVPVSELRMLEKTPKNALRIPFLKAAFPDARFLYLHRDPRQVLASMIEGWESGEFVMYPELPGWRGPAWSFLLTPNWRELSGLTLPEIVAGQWQSTQQVLLDDLGALDADSWAAIDYEDLVRNPQAAAAGCSEWAGWQWDTQLGRALPHSRYTLTPPSAGKWRRHAASIEPLLGGMSELVTYSLQALHAGRARLPIHG